MITENIDAKLSNPKILLAVLFVAIGGLAAGFGAIFLDNPLYPLLAVLGVAAILVAIRKPVIGLLVLVFITYIRLSNVLVEYHHLPSIAKFYIPFLLGIIAMRWVVYREEPRGWQLAFVPLAIYGFVIGASIFYARNPGIARTEFDDYVKDAIMVIVIVIILQKGATLRQVIWALLLAGIFLGSLTTYQQLSGSFTNNFGGFANAEVRNIFGEVNDYRIQGPISSNYYALVLVALVPLEIDRLVNEKARWLRFLAVWALFVTTFSIFFTFSRGGLFAMLLVIALMLIRYPPKRAYIFGAVILLPLLLFILPASYFERLGNLTQIASIMFSQSAGDPGLQENALRGRLSEMTVSAQVFADHPLTGVGYGNFEEYYLDYSPALGLDLRRENRAAHSLYLEIAAETGILGLAAFGFLLFSAFRGLNWAYKRLMDAKLENYANIAYALAVSLIGYLAGSIFLHASYFRYFWLIFAVACALPQVAKYELEARQISWKSNAI
jgi:putative inorganic carbon (HCO3(-)) transporter